VTDAPPEPRTTAPHRRLRTALGWLAAIVAVVVAAWLVVALAPRPPRPRLVDDPQAPESAACGAFGEPAPAVEGVIGYVPCWLPDGFMLSDASTGRPPPDIGETDVSYVVYYSRDAGDATPDSVTVLTLLSDLPPTPTNTTVRRAGTDKAAQFEELTDGSLQLRWAEGDGVNIRVIARGAVTRDELTRTAESLVHR
jgi:hypothetical protein